MKDLQGYLAHKKLPPPHGATIDLGMVLLEGPRGRLFLMSEVALYGTWHENVGSCTPIEPLFIPSKRASALES